MFINDFMLVSCVGINYDDDDDDELIHMLRLTHQGTASGAKSDVYNCVVCLMQLWLTDVEIFATVIAALVHDYEHNGTTNTFHVNTE